MDTNVDSKSGFSEWAKVELMGRQVVVGLVQEATLAGGAFLRVDVPATGTEKAFTRFYRPEAIYCISPIAEDVARKLVEYYSPAPVQRYELPQIAEKVAEPDRSGLNAVVDGDDEDDEDTTF